MKKLFIISTLALTLVACTNQPLDTLFKRTPYGVAFYTPYPLELSLIFTDAPVSFNDLENDAPPPSEPNAQYPTLIRTLATGETWQAEFSCDGCRILAIYTINGVSFVEAVSSR